MDTQAITTRLTDSLIERKHFKTSREIDYLSVKELTTQTGHRPEEWPLVVLKELIDNGLDAAEEAGIAPDIKVVVNVTGITICDNGPGIPESVIDGVLDFTIRVSSREAYVAPDRGAQGNALKTLVAMPFALFGAGKVVIVANGIRHEISVSVDQIHQKPKIEHKKSPVGETTGTSFFVQFGEDQACFAVDDENVQLLQNEDFDRDEACLILANSKHQFLQLADSYTWLNPHLTLTVDWFGDKKTVERSSLDWLKWKPSHPTDPHWYAPENLQRLIAAHLCHGTKMVRELVTEFKGLKSTQKVKRVLQACDLSRAELTTLVDGDQFNEQKIVELLNAMKAETKPVKPKALGVVGEEHFRQRCESLGGDMDSFKYKKILDFNDENCPFVIETVFCYCEDLEFRRLVTGVNWSPGIANPFRSLGNFGRSLDSILNNKYAGEDEEILFLLHVACPKVAYADRGKSTVIVKG